MKYISEYEARERYRECLDGVCPEVRIGSLTYSPSRVLEKVDPIAFNCGFAEWLDSEGLTTSENEADEDGTEADE